MNEFRSADELRDLAFDEAQQAEIIARAAALQREHGQRATLSDLERAALEAGIEPRFVREAVRQSHEAPRRIVAMAPNETSDATWHYVLAAAIFVPAEIVAISWSHEPLESLWAAIMVAVLFGLALPRRLSSRVIAVLWPPIIAISIIVFDRAARINDRWTLDIVAAATQSAVALGVYMFRTRRPRVEPRRESEGG